MHNWLKWLFLCTLATFPYNLWGLVMGALQPSFQANGFLIGAFILFIGFVTCFFLLDKWLIRHNYTDFSKTFLQVVGIKFLLSIVGVVLLVFMERLIRFEYVFYGFFSDVFLTFDFYKFLREHFRDMAQRLITNPDWYNLLKLLILVPIYLVIESVLLLLGTMFLAMLKQKFGQHKTD